MKPGFQLIDTVGEDSTHSASQVRPPFFLMHNKLGYSSARGSVVLVEGSLAKHVAHLYWLASCTAEQQAVCLDRAAL